MLVTCALDNGVDNRGMSIIIGVDPGTSKVHWAAIEKNGSKLTYLESHSTAVTELNEVRQMIRRAGIVVIEKPGGTLYGKVRYDHLITISVNAGRVYQLTVETTHGVIKPDLVNAHGRGGWRPALLKAGKGVRMKGQEVLELELLLTHLVDDLPLRKNRLKGVINEHQRDALGIALWGALIRPLMRTGRLG